MRNQAKAAVCVDSRSTSSFAAVDTVSTSKSSLPATAAEGSPLL
jgi:hypothetical protein